MSITIQGYSFTGPYFHTRKFNTDFACVYVIINNNNQIVDVGQTDNINSRIINHERKTCWYQHGCSDSGLYVYISQDQNFRSLLERLIRIAHTPPCGEY